MIRKDEIYHCLKTEFEKIQDGSITITENDQQEERCRPSFVQPVDWSECVFCEKYKHKGNTNLSQILTYTAEYNLKEAAKVPSDIQMLRKINGVDLKRIPWKLFFCLHE